VAKEMVESLMQDHAHPLTGAALMPASGYYIDLNAFTLQRLKSLLKIIRLLPSQQILGEDVDERFACLEQCGFENLQQLQNALKTKSDVQALAKRTGLPVDYLTILRREVNSYQPKPIRLSDFPGVDSGTVRQLDQIGIRNTKQLFPYVLTPDDRSQFSFRNQIEPDILLELTKLTDVARLKWVGPKFARLLVESEYDTVEKIANSDYEALYHALAQVNEEKNIYKGTVGLEDMKHWVNTVVQEVPRVIQY
jgi:hypothetical protein